MSSFIPATINGKNYTIGEHDGKPVMFRESLLKTGMGEEEIMGNLRRYYADYQRQRESGERKEPLRMSEYNYAADHFNKLIQKRLRVNIAMSERCLKDRNKVSVCVIPEVFILRKPPTPEELDGFVNAGNADSPMGKWCADKGYEITTIMMHSPYRDYTMMFAILSPTIARVEKAFPDGSKTDSRK